MEEGRLRKNAGCLSVPKKEMKINMLREDWGSEPYGRLSGTRHTGLGIEVEMAYEERETAHKNGPRWIQPCIVAVHSSISPEFELFSSMLFIA